MAKKKQSEKDRVIIFDTTLRDGEQSPGATMTINEKLQVAQQLARLNVDVIEAGFPFSSPGDFEAVQLISRHVHGPTIAGLCRTEKADIEKAWDAVKDAEKNRLHTFIATSPIHMKKKLGKKPAQVVKMAQEGVARCRGYTDDVEFSCEDATRSDFSFLCEIVEKAIDAGATTINIPDTVGYTLPQEFIVVLKELINKVPNSNRAIFSTHCHNDLGLAVANSLAAIVTGARQVECTINGLGERAGNASLEEIVMGLRTRADIMKQWTGIVTTEIYRTSRLVARVTGIDVQPNKAIVGRNAFAHEAGIHQHGMLKDKRTYEIMDADSIGLSKSNLVLGKHSGRHAFIDKLTELGYELDSAQTNKAFAEFKNLCDKKKTVTDQDLMTIVEDEIMHIPETYRLISVNVMCGGRVKATAMIEMYHGDRKVEESAIGVGPVDSVYQCIRKITGEDIQLVDFSVKSVTGGIDAIGEVTVRISGKENKMFTGKGGSLDIIEASAKAYTTAINKMLFWRENEERRASESVETGKKKPAKKKSAGKGKSKK